MPELVAFHVIDRAHSLPDYFTAKPHRLTAEPQHKLNGLPVLIPQPSNSLRDYTPALSQKHVNAYSSAQQSYFPHQHPRINLR